ncbi:MAG: VWA domain-containing protein [Acidobacteria bacterium]|nr:VWA domain-containing protein [Acidobacteriota bacterium]
MVLLLGLFLASKPLRGQQFTSGVSLVEVYVSVTDDKGQPVRNLNREDFEVLESDVPQAISTFTAGDVPLSVAIAIDRSFSMSGTRLTMARAGARTFLEELRAGDDAMVVGIGSEVEVLAPLSRDRRAQFAVVDRLDAFGTTGLHDALVTSIAAVQPARGRRALVLLSDGDDKYSQASENAALRAAREADVMIYPIALGVRRPPLFAELATLTGGRSSHVRDGKGLPEVTRGIARELREQYFIGYTPSRPIVAGANEWRSIVVRVKRPGVVVRARDGYMAR